MKNSEVSWCILAGNVIDGLVVYGPYRTPEEANEAGDVLRDEWIVARMECFRPEGLGGES